jgi:RimJ/RimL family protein N-acetyltransferase
MQKIQLVLASPDRHDVVFLHDCFTSKDIRGSFQPCRNISVEKVMQEIIASADTRRFVFIVEQDANAIGYAYAHHIPAFDHYEIGATLLPSMRERGIGTLVHKMLLTRIFNVYKARRLHAFVSTKNIAEVKVLEACGFLREGVMRSGGILDGAWHDLAVYGLLFSDVWEVAP